MTYVHQNWLIEVLQTLSSHIYPILFVFHKKIWNLSTFTANCADSIVLSVLLLIRDDKTYHDAVFLVGRSRYIASSSFTLSAWSCQNLTLVNSDLSLIFWTKCFSNSGLPQLFFHLIAFTLFLLPSVSSANYIRHPPPIRIRLPRYCKYTELQSYMYIILLCFHSFI